MPPLFGGETIDFGGGGANPAEAAFAEGRRGAPPSTVGGTTGEAVGVVVLTGASEVAGETDRPDALAPLVTSEVTVVAIAVGVALGVVLSVALGDGVRRRSAASVALVAAAGTTDAADCVVLVLAERSGATHPTASVAKSPTPPRTRTTDHPAPAPPARRT